MRNVSKLEFVAIAVAMASTAIAVLLFKRLNARRGDQLTVSLAPDEGSRAEGGVSKRRFELIIEHDPQVRIQ